MQLSQETHSWGLTELGTDYPQKIFCHEVLQIRGKDPAPVMIPFPVELTIDHAEPGKPFLQRETRVLPELRVDVFLTGMFSISLLAPGIFHIEIDSRGRCTQEILAPTLAERIANYSTARGEEASVLPSHGFLAPASSLVCLEFPEIYMWINFNFRGKGKTGFNYSSSVKSLKAWEERRKTHPVGNSTITGTPYDTWQNLKYLRKDKNFDSSVRFVNGVTQ